MLEYMTPAAPCEASVTEKRSEFIAQLFPADSAEACAALIAQVKAKHHKARHKGWAYNLQNGQSRFSDDGEPQGTGGIPVLNVLQKAGLTDVCCVVTRYFGGVLLGAPGLTRAYSEAAAQAVKSAQIRHFCEANRVRLVIGYDLYPTVSYLLPKYGAVTVNQDFGERVTLELEIKTDVFGEVEAALTDLMNGAPTWELLETHFVDLNAAKQE